MRDIRKGNCPLCNHHEIIEVQPAEFGASDIERPAAVTYKGRWVMAGRNPNEPIGGLRNFVCRSCGFCQSFVTDVASVPTESGYTRLIVGVKDTAPYR